MTISPELRLECVKVAAQYYGRKLSATLHIARTIECYIESGDSPFPAPDFGDQEQANA